MSSSHSLDRHGGALLCELHAHSTWSDGGLSVAELVDLYGGAGFDVLAVTDHVVRDGGMVSAANHGDYLADVRAQADRARSAYGLVVIPGLELTWDDADDTRAAHAVAVGLERHVSLDQGLDAAVETARDAGAAIIAAHPHATGHDAIPGRTTRRWWLDRQLRGLAHRFELINRLQTFDWVAAEGLPAVASGDFHRPAHMATWKTMVPCQYDAAAVVEHLRSAQPVMLAPPGLRPAREDLGRAAA
jgi:predicted metal-dependent phosphoesterase TrpH